MAWLGFASLRLDLNDSEGGHRRKMTKKSARIENGKKISVREESKKKLKREGRKKNSGGKCKRSAKLRMCKCGSARKKIEVRVQVWKKIQVGCKCGKKLRFGWRIGS